MNNSEEFLQYITDLPELTPLEIFINVRKYNYIGQEKAVKALSLMACRHIRRLKHVFLDRVNMDDLPPKDNFLLVGPTGCGKTYLVDLIFQKILDLPATVIDITSYSETGYIGQDVVSILSRLVHAAEGDYMKASVGIVCIDEFDKLSTSKNSAVFSGQGTTKDVSGFGVQKELLKMLEGAELDVPIELTHSSYSERSTMSTDFISFIALGAFSGLTNTINHNNKVIGYGRAKTGLLENKIAYTLREEDLNRVLYFQEYGLMPELIGRFSRIVPFHALDRNTLKEILLKNTLEKYDKEFQLINSKLNINDLVIDKILDQAIQNETGARGIRTALYTQIEEACFELYSRKNKKSQVDLTLKDDEVVWEIH